METDKGPQPHAAAPVFTCPVLPFERFVLVHHLQLRWALFSN